MAMALGNQSIFKEKKSINLYVYNTHRWCHNKKVDIFLYFEIKVYIVLYKSRMEYSAYSFWLCTMKLI